ncbi:hypothetical protein NON20_24610 (plasmid) [Synechocystis sp. B12]|nr:hypothetical protein NON20_24610 [Synechocystis sp. B12]
MTDLLAIAVKPLVKFVDHLQHPQCTVVIHDATKYRPHRKPGFSRADFASNR